MEYTADTYRLSFAADRPYVIVDTARGERVAELFVLSSVHPLNGRDDTLGIGEWEVDPHPEETSFTLRAASSAWHSKTYRFRCRPNRFTYEVEVEGRGDLAETNLFGGYYSGQVRWGAILHSEAKKVKPDALIVTHTPHPYLADVVDMIRLNDINCGADINRAMTHRARVAAIACPNAAIDTDNWPMPDKESWRKYTRLQPSLGVPSLYFSTHIDSTGEPLTAEDYQLIRDTWQEHAGRAGNLPM